MPDYEDVKKAADFLVAFAAGHQAQYC